MKTNGIEVTIARLRTEGSTWREIADRVGVSLRTVHRHRYLCETSLRAPSEQEMEAKVERALEERAARRAKFKQAVFDGIRAGAGWALQVAQTEWALRHWHTTSGILVGAPAPGCPLCR